MAQIQEEGASLTDRAPSRSSAKLAASGTSPRRARKTAAKKAVRSRWLPSTRAGAGGRGCAPSADAAAWTSCACCCALRVLQTAVQQSKLEKPYVVASTTGHYLRRALCCHGCTADDAESQQPYLMASGAQHVGSNARSSAAYCCTSCELLLCGAVSFCASVKLAAAELARWCDNHRSSSRAG